jgi:hypothetical protein
MKIQNISLSILVFIALTVFITSCNTGDKGWYGEEFEISNPVSADELSDILGDNEAAPVQVQGMISGVCRSEGCWISMKTSDDKLIYINTKDKAFSLPQSVQGKMATVKGEVWSVEKQIAQAKGEGWEEEDLDWIENISIEANGIFVE